MKNQSPPFVIATPCPKSWNEMSGDARRRFCAHCQLHVHNLSAMPPPEQERLVEQAGGQACIAYELRPDGSPVAWSRWRWLFRPFQRLQWTAVTLLATLMPFLFASCASRRTATLGMPPSSSPDAMHSDHELGRRPMVGRLQPLPKTGASEEP